MTCLMAPSHYMNQCWLSSKVFCSIHLRAVSEEVLVNLICNLCWNITLLKLLPHFPGLDELIMESVHLGWNFLALKETQCHVPVQLWYCCLTVAQYQGLSDNINISISIHINIMPIDSVLIQTTAALIQEGVTKVCSCHKKVDWNIFVRHTRSYNETP